MLDPPFGATPILRRNMSGGAPVGAVVPLDEKREPLDKLMPLLDLVAEDMAKVNGIILD